MLSRSFAGLIQGGWRDLAFEPFRDGIDVHYLAHGDNDEASLAVLRYRAGARVQRHHHPGLETIIVLEGVQSDERGDYAAGSVVINAPGSEHSVWTEAGCVVLIHWARPVVLLE